MSRHVVFLEYIPFFSIPSTTHNLTKSDIIHIDPFYEDSGNDTSPRVQSICTHKSAGTGTLLSGTPEASFSSIALKLHLRLWIYLYVNIYAFVSSQSY